MIPVLWGWLTGQIVFLALWGLAAGLGIALKWSLLALGPFLPPILLLAGLAGWWDCARRQRRDAGDDPSSLPPDPQTSVAWWGRLCALALVGALPFAGHAYLAVWILALLACLNWLWHERAIIQPIRMPPPRSYDGILLAAAALIGLAASLCAIRPDSDDFGYFWAMFQMLDHPDRPLHALLVEQISLPEALAWHPYEILLALLAHLGAVSVPDLYYLVLPGWWTLSLPVIVYLSLRQWGMRQAGWGALAAIALLIVWAGAHRSPGNFAFVRLYQAKAVLACWGLPLVFLYGGRLARERDGAAWALAILSLTAAGCLWHSAIVLAPLAALAGGLPFAPAWKQERAFWLGSGGLAAILGLAALYTAQHYPVWIGTCLNAVFAADPRSVLALIAPLIAAWGLGGGRARGLLRVQVLFLLVLINPAFLMAVAHLAASLTWRNLWVLPWPVLTVLAALTWWRSGFRIGVAAAGLVFVLWGPWTLSPDNGTRLAWPDWKANAALRRWLDGDHSELILFDSQGARQVLKPRI